MGVDHDPKLKNNCPRCARLRASNYAYLSPACELCQGEDLPDALIIEYYLLYPSTEHDPFNVIPGWRASRKLRERHGLSVKW